MAISRGDYDTAYAMVQQATIDYKYVDDQAYIAAENFLGVMSQNYAHFKGKAALSNGSSYSG